MEQLASASDIEAINRRLDDITKLMLTGKLKGTVSVMDIAEFEGVSRGFLYGKGAYLLPRYGKSGYPDKADARWNTEEYLKWREIPAETRAEAYSRVSRKSKQKENRLNGTNL